MPSLCCLLLSSRIDICSLKLNEDGEAPEDVQGVGGTEQKLAKQHVIDSCGKP